VVLLKRRLAGKSKIAGLIAARNEDELFEVDKVKDL
jgi:hypothetical protein